MGKKIAAQMVITFSVISLDTASQTVKLKLGSMLDGIIKGNVLTAKVINTPAWVTLLKKKAKALRLNLLATQTNIGNDKPIAGAIIVSGYLS